MTVISDSGNGKSRGCLPIQLFIFVTNFVEKSMYKLKNSNEYRITNIQSTVSIVPDEFNLPMKDIAHALHGCSKLSNKFAAIIQRVYFGIAATTCMIFKDGKVIVVGSISPRHAIFASHMYRLYISSVHLSFFNPGANAYTKRTLESMTTFTAFKMNNMCGTAHLGYRVNSSKLARLNQHTVEYNPEVFPGFCAVVNVNPTRNIKATVFDNGKFTITGCGSVKDVSNGVTYIRRLTKDFQDKTGALPRSQRYDHRIAEKTRGALLSSGMKLETSSENKKTGYGLSDVLSMLPPRTVHISTGPMLVRAFLTKNLELIIHLLKMGRNPLREAIEYLESKNELSLFLRCTLEWLYGIKI